MAVFFFFFKQKTAYEMRISDWSSDVCSSDLILRARCVRKVAHPAPEIELESCDANADRVAGSVAQIVKLEHAWRRLDGRNDDGFHVAPFPRSCAPVGGDLVLSLSDQLSRPSGHSGGTWPLPRPHADIHASQWARH